MQYLPRSAQAAAEVLAHSILIVLFTRCHGKSPFFYPKSNYYWPAEWASIVLLAGVCCRL